MFAPLFRSNSAAALRPSCAANMRAARSSSDEEDRTSLMIVAQLGREAVAELLLKKGQIPTAGKENKQFWLPKGGKKTNNFWLGSREIHQELVPREQGRRRESF